MNRTNNQDLNLDKIIAQQIGELTIRSAKQAVLIETLRMEIVKRDAEIARLKQIEPELDLPRVTASTIEAANGSAH